MTHQPLFSTSFGENFANIGAPLAVIALWCVHTGQPVGNAGSFVAACFAAVLCTTFARFGLEPMLRALQVRVSSLMGHAYRAGVNATLGALSLVAVNALGLF